MSNRRRNIFILAFVALLIVGSGLVIATKKTTLGLDLKGGTELIFQAKPTPQNPTIDSADMERAIEIILVGIQISCAQQQRTLAHRILRQPPAQEIAKQTVVCERAALVRDKQPAPGDLGQKRRRIAGLTERVAALRR